MDKILLQNCRRYDSSDGKDRIDVLIEKGRIAEIGEVHGKIENAVILDAAGRILAPGFIDVHIQGAGGSDVLDGSADALRTISRTLARFGTTGFLATTVIHKDGGNHHLKLAAQHAEKPSDGAQLFGIHIEGPFINPVRRGGIAETAIHQPSMNLLKDILAMTGRALKMMTIAPELEGNREIIEKLIQSGVIASFGHSDASYQQTKQGFDSGITHVTHIFNAMPGLHHRIPGPLPAIFETENISVQIIADGVHLHPAIVRMIYRSIGIGRSICITDGIQAIGLPEGRYFYNRKEYESRAGAARYLDGTLIGTAISLNAMIPRFMAFTDCSLRDAIYSVSGNPARLLGLGHRKGDISVGMDADLVLLNDDFSVHITIIDGRIVFAEDSGNQEYIDMKN